MVVIFPTEQFTSWTIWGEVFLISLVIYFWGVIYMTLFGADEQELKEDREKRLELSNVEVLNRY
jgi:hypothetical protein